MFWREESVWPLTHYVYEGTLYLATRNIFLSLWLVYVWESVEDILAGGNRASRFWEPWYDSLLGDPLMGSTAIATLFVADVVFQWNDAIAGSVPWGWRVLHFVIVWVLSFSTLSSENDDRWINGRPPEHKRTLRWSALIVGATYIPVTLLIYGINIQRAPEPLRARAWASVVAWLVVVAVQCVVTLPVVRVPTRQSAYAESVFVRVYTVALVAFAVLCIVTAVVI